jgi:SAM-dependent methyltransferase
MFGPMEPQRDPHWFEPLATHMGDAYLRYSFTKGTVGEVDVLMEVLELKAGSVVLDLGCGPGRHLHELARRGCRVVGLDISDAFVRLAAARGSDLDVAVVRGDVRDLPLRGQFDAVISLCQGGFGLLGGPGALSYDPDTAVLAECARVLRPGGRLALSAFSSYFQVKYLSEDNTFDAASGTNHERTEVRDSNGVAVGADLWTTCYTPRELRLMAAAASLEVCQVASVEPGQYSLADPSIESPEFLLIARRPQLGD